MTFSTLIDVRSVFVGGGTAATGTGGGVVKDSPMLLQEVKHAADNMLIASA